MVKAVAVLRGDSTASGTVTLTQAADQSGVSLEISLKGLKPGKHGFHIQ